MKRLLSTALLGLLVAGMASSALAFDNRYASIALHITPVNAFPVGQACDRNGLTAATVVAQTPQVSTPAGPFFWTYLIVCNGSDSTGIAGMEMGLNYDGAAGGFGNPGGPIQVYNWVRCADLEFPIDNWPAPGSGNLLTWDRINNCQIAQSETGVPRTVIAIGGYMYMGAYAPSQMFVIPRPVSGRAQVADCESREDDITFYAPPHLGTAGFGGASGYNPCGAPTPVEKTTWGGVKSLIND